MYYLNKIVNKLSGAVEISAPMAAAAVLEMPAETCSDSFWVVFISAAVTYAKNHPEATPLEAIQSSEREFDDIDSDDDWLDDDSLSEEDIELSDEEDCVIVDDDNEPEDDESKMIDETPEPQTNDHVIIDDFFALKEL